MSEFHDPYVDQRTGVLRNLIGATSQSALDAAESDLTYARAIQLRRRSIPRTNDLAELCAIHNHLFQDVYDWAGQPRTVEIRKKSDGAAFFAPVRMIERSAGYAAESLREDGFLRALPRERLIERLALHYDQFNYLHPFREGNGRTQRIFWSRVVRDAGYDLDWRDIPGEVNDAACHTAAAGDLSGLVAMFDALVTKLP